jgi:hypothetical protein
VLVRDRQRERAGAGPEIDDDRRRHAGQPLQRPAGELLGLRPRHEDAGADGQLQVAEGRPAGEVLQRHAVRALVEQGAEPHGDVVRHCDQRQQPAAGDAQDRRQQQLGVHARGLHPGVGEAAGGACEQVAGSHERTPS